jgi:endonuclease YncB( thermonuclease family)
MRLRNIDTPDIDGKCHQERQLASRATQRLLVLVQSGVRTITRYGHDPYGRALVTVETNVGMAGDILLREGLADRFGDGIRANWCRS